MPRRSLKATVQHLQRVYGEAQLPPSEGVPSTYGHSRLLEAVAKSLLPNTKRTEAARLRAEGLTTKEIGRALGVSVRSVRNLLHRVTLPVRVKSVDGFAYARAVLPRRDDRRRQQVRPWLPVVVWRMVCSACGWRTYALARSNVPQVGLQILTLRCQRCRFDTRRLVYERQALDALKGPPCPRCGPGVRLAVQARAPWTRLGHCMRCRGRRAFTVEAERPARADDVRRWRRLTRQKRLAMVQDEWAGYFDSQS
jgi:hypothetical protein